MNGKNRNNIAKFPNGRRPGGNGQGGSAGNGGSAEIVERLVRLEAKMENVATRKDISDLKTHISNNQNSALKWMVATLVAAVAALFAILQFFAKGG